MNRTWPRRLGLIVLSTLMVWGITNYADSEPAATAQGKPQDSIVLGDTVSNKSLTEQNADIEAQLRDQPSGDDLYQMADDGEYLAVTEAQSPRLDPSDTSSITAIDPVTWAECAQNFDINVKPYWLKNKYNICRRSTITLVFILTDSNGTIVDRGTIEFRLEFIGTARLSENAIDFRFRMLDFKESGWTRPDWLFHVHLPCLNADPDRDSDCLPPSGSPSFYEMPVGEWRSRSGEEFTLTQLGTTTAVPTGEKYQQEMRGFFAFGLQLTLFTPRGPDAAVLPDEMFRCDIAQYVGGSKCVFTNVGSVLEFKLSTATTKESVAFIQDAQTDITRTKPGIANKKVPGVVGDIPLHRLFNTYDTKNHIQASRRKIRKTCRRYYGTNYTQNRTKQCDEYPFATTYENSARVDTTTVYDYAVRAITGTHNEAAGNAYGAWLTADHILDGDPFWVKIVP